MKKISALAASAVTLGLLAVPGAARAASGVTITGPKVAPYYATAIIRGTSTAPSQAVTVFFRHDGQPWQVGRRLVSDSHGHFRTTFTASTGLSYYATAGGAQSAAASTTIVTGSCSVGGAAFTPPTDLPSPQGYLGEVSLTAVRDSTWAGYTFDDSSWAFRVITWRKGQSSPTVVARIDRGAGAYRRDAKGPVSVVGITPQGAVVGALAIENRQDVQFRGVAWYHGRTYQLQAPASFTYVRPMGVADNGFIVATAVRKSRSYVLGWKDFTSPVHVLADLGPLENDTVQLDSRGDAAFRTGPYQWSVRLTNGRIVPLQNFDGGAVPSSGVGSTIFATSNHYVESFDVAHAAATVPFGALVDGRGSSRYVDAADTRGDLVIRDGHDLAWTRTARGAFIALPRIVGGSAFTVNKSGTIATTLASDNLVHLITCH